MTSWKLACVILTSLALVSGCTSQSRPAAQSPTAAAAATVELGGRQLPDLALLKSTCSGLSDTLLGAEAFQSSANAIVAGDDLELVSEATSSSWGIWEFAPELRSVESVEVEMSVSTGGSGDQGAYIALADYEAGAWQFDGPLTSGKQLALDEARHRSEDGQVYVAVIVADPVTAVVNRVTLNSEDGWSVDIIRSATTVAHLDLAMIEGRPAIAYCVQGIALSYLRANDEHGLNWGGPTTVDTDNDIGNRCSLCAVDGNPAISYYEQGDDDLYFVRATDSVGGDWGDPLVANGGGDSGLFNSMVVADGLPMIAYYFLGESYIAYARAANADGTGWGFHLVIENEGQSGRYLDLAIVNGVPAVSYVRDDYLYYAWANNANGDGWTHFVAVDDSTATSNTSLAVIAGVPSIAYLDVTNKNLKYARAQDAPGTDWAPPQTIDGSLESETGHYASLAEIDGVPAVAYFNATDEDLYYIQARDPDGFEWYAPKVIDGAEEETGYYCRLCNVNGNPAIAYYSSSANALMYAVRQLP
jgi:hypothetical protein